jgi:hypothetical protein
MKSLAVLSSLLLAHSASAQYQLVRSYAGSSFFSGWDFYGSYDNLTNGDVIWEDQANATSQKLAYVNSAGNAIIKVDNTSDVIYNDKRDSVRITTHDAYPLGTLIVFSATHLPYGCSVWPSFWTKGVNWPNDGEIDIFETVNLMDHNQMALHTLTGCTKASDAVQSGTNGATNCSTSAGCIVADSNNNSVGAAFAAAGGGVWATQFDTSGVFIWFWNTANVPSNLNSGSSVDTSTWGTPTASYPSSTCNMTQAFGPQQLVLDITLCGDWAGLPAVYNATCLGTGTTGLCYNDNVIGAGSPHYDNAYFEISYVKVFALSSVASSISASLATETFSTGSPSGTSSGHDSGSSGTGGASGISLVLIFAAIVVSLV